MLSGNAQNAIIGWEAHGPRIITARFKTNKNCKSVWTYPIQVSLRAPLLTIAKKKTKRTSTTDCDPLSRCVLGAIWLYRWLSGKFNRSERPVETKDRKSLGLPNNEGQEKKRWIG